MVLVAALDWQAFQPERSVDDVHAALSRLLQGRVGGAERRRREASGSGRAGRRRAGPVWPRPPRATPDRRRPPYCPDARSPPYPVPPGAGSSPPVVAPVRRRPADVSPVHGGEDRAVPPPRVGGTGAAPLSVPPLSRSRRSAAHPRPTHLTLLGTDTQPCALRPRPLRRRLVTIASVSVLPLVFTSGWASGINAYAVVLLLGLFGATGLTDEVPESLQRPDVLIAAGVLFLCEAVADKIPYVDSVWDSVHTVIRPVSGRGRRRAARRAERFAVRSWRPARSAVRRRWPAISSRPGPGWRSTPRPSRSATSSEHRARIWASPGSSPSRCSIRWPPRSSRACCW